MHLATVHVKPNFWKTRDIDKETEAKPTIVVSTWAIYVFFILRRRLLNVKRETFLVDFANEVSNNIFHSLPVWN